MQIIINFIIRKLYKIVIKLLELFIPQNNNWIAIIGRYDGAFENNSMYFFQYLYTKDNFQGWWFTKSKDSYKKLSQQYPGHIAYTYSLKGVSIFIKSRFAICSYSAKNFNPLYISKKKICINLWHGIPLKRIGYLDPAMKGFNLKKFNEDLETVDYMVTSSFFEADLFQKCFRKDKNKIIVSGTPRNDFLLKDNINDDITDRNILENHKIILYAPTFRAGKKTDLLPFEGLDLEELNSFLERNNAYLLIRKHHNEALRYTKLYTEGNIKSKIIFAGQDRFPDAQILLKFTDILITDYSSIYFDFLLLNRPCIFVPYDYEDYINERNFLFDYHENTPGPKLYSQSDIISYIEKCFNDPSTDEELRANLIQKFHRYTDGHANERILAKIIEINN
jgi:CDP-glycerol glycerophosphotransferase (TagB/SpsB family)